MRRAAEAVESDGCAGANLGTLDCAIADDSGTQQWRNLGIGNGVRQRVSEVLAHGGEFRITAIMVPPSEAGVGAKVFASAPAIDAQAASLTQPRDTDARTRRKAFASGTKPFDHANYLVAGDDLRMLRCKIALADTEIGTAYAAAGHANQDFARAGCRRRELGERERKTLDCRRRMYHHCTHQLLC